MGSVGYTVDTFGSGGVVTTSVVSSGFGAGVGNATEQFVGNILDGQTINQVDV